MFFEITFDSKNKRLIQIYKGIGKYSSSYKFHGETLLYDGLYHHLILGKIIPDRMKEKELHYVTSRNR